MITAAQFATFGPPDVLGLGERPEPEPGPGQVRIRVFAAGVSPVDLGLRAGTTPVSTQLPLPHVTGLDAAGVVDQVGDAVSGTRVGDEVFGTVELTRFGGATAALAVLDEWTARPTELGWHEAAAAGTSVETATRALDRAGLVTGSTLLIDGVAGGVGTVLAQLAVARGLRVVGTAREANFEFVTGLGAEPVRYGEGLSRRVPDGVDFAIDVAGAGSLTELVTIVGGPERVLTLADFGGPKLGVPISLGRLGGEADGWHGLDEAARLAGEGRFRVPIQQVFSWRDAGAAHEAAGSGPRRGKVVIAVD